jgi:hypothetical protein
MVRVTWPKELGRIANGHAISGVSALAHDPDQAAEESGHSCRQDAEEDDVLQHAPPSDRQPGIGGVLNARREAAKHESSGNDK